MLFISHIFMKHRRKFFIILFFPIWSHYLWIFLLKQVNLLSSFANWSYMFIFFFFLSNNNQMLYCLHITPYIMVCHKFNPVAIPKCFIFPYSNPLKAEVHKLYKIIQFFTLICTYCQALLQSLLPYLFSSLFHITLHHYSSFPKMSISTKLLLH